jgi:hypothetical protein
LNFSEDVKDFFRTEGPTEGKGKIAIVN